jgi:hypothetical protein
VTSHTWRLFLAFGLAAAVVYFLLPNDVRVGAASSAVLHHIGAVVSLGVGDAAFLSTSLPDLADAFWLATALLGLEVNRRRGDDLRPALAPDAGPARPPGQAGVATTNTSGFPLVELALADADDLDAVGRHLFDRGIYVTLAPYPVVPRREVGFRIEVTAANTAEQVDHLLAVLEELDGRFGFRRPHL